MAHALVTVRSLDRPPRAIPDIAIFRGRDGRYRWTLRPGRYAVTATARGFLHRTQTVAVTAGRLKPLDFTLLRK